MPLASGEPPFFGGLVACRAARSQARDGSHRRWFRECHVALVPGGDSFGWPRIRTDHGKIKRTRYEHGLAGPAGASWVDRGSGRGVWASAGQCDKGRSVV